MADIVLGLLAFGIGYVCGALFHRHIKRIVKEWLQLYGKKKKQ